MVSICICMHVNYSKKEEEKDLILEDFTCSCVTQCRIGLVRLYLVTVLLVLEETQIIKISLMMYG